MSTVLDELRRKSRECPDEAAFDVFHKHDEPRTELHWRALQDRSDAVAAALSRTLSPGARVVVMTPAGIDFVVAFVGVLRAGCCAVPMPAGITVTALARIDSIMKDCGAEAVIANASTDHCTPAGIQRFTVEQLEVLGANVGDVDLDARGPAPHDLAFLQYTSGSTSRPKGVMVEHSQLDVHLAQLTDAFGLTPNHHIITWLPPFHDMGLIGNILLPIALGAKASILPPRGFLRRPLEWIGAIASSDRPVAAGGPNFGFDLCARKIRPRESSRLDLSNWKIAFCGAEPIDGEVARRFALSFRRSGFDPSAFTPCYGLAEACLAVTSHRPGKRWRSERLQRDATDAAVYDEDGGLEVVCVGPPVKGAEVAIVAPDSVEELPARSIGEIVVTGKNVARGYWGAPEATAAVFAHGVGGRRSVRTGDLGYLDENGALFITGRLKELCIVRGRNLYPHDLEAFAERAHPNIRKVFATTEAGRLILLAEVERRGPHQRRKAKRPEDERRHDEYDPGSTPVDYDVMVRVLREVIVDQFGVAPDEVALLRVKSLPHTSSGKRMRIASYNSWRNGRLPSLHHWVANVDPSRRKRLSDSPFPTDATPPPDFVRRRLRRVVAAAAQVENEDLVSDASTISSMGLDSVRAVEMVRDIERQFGVMVSELELLESTFGRLHLIVAKRMLSPDPDFGAADSAELEEEDSRARALTPDETAMWLSSRLSQDADPALNYRFRCGDRLEAEVLATALEMLIDRHPALRTSYYERRGVPRAKEHAWVAPALEVHAVDGEESVAATALEFERARFDLEQPPLVRVALIRAPDYDHLVIKIHHIATDLQSLPLLWRGLSEAFAAAQLGTRPEWGTETVSPAQFLLWQRWYMSSSAGGRARDYWERKLAEAMADPLRLGAARPARGALPAQSVSEPLTGWASRLTEFATRHNTSVQNVLLTCFQLALGQVSGQQRIPVASTYAARGSARFDELVGYMINVVPRVLHIERDATGETLVARNEQEGREALGHRHYPVASLPQSITQAASALFSFEIIPHADQSWGRVATGAEGVVLRLGENELSLIPGASRSSDFDMELLAEVGADDVHLSWSGSGPGGMALVAGVRRAFTEVLTALVEDASRPLSTTVSRTLTLSTRVPSASIDRTHEAPLDVVAAFRIAAREHPDIEALRFGDQSVTYAEMDARTDSLAAALRARGVSPGSRVGILLDRGLMLVEAIWAVWKAGAAYVPLDPELPGPRLELMVHDASPELVLTTEALGAQAPAGARTIAVDALDLGSDAPKPPRVPLKPMSPAYMIYTSGSTGRPKGVVSHHGGLANRLHWMQRAFKAGPGYRVAHKTPFSFDVSVWELSWPLLTGATMCIAPPGIHADALALQQWLSKEEVQLVHFVPSMLRVWLETAAEPGSLAAVVASGEALPDSVAEAFARKLPHVALENLYGPTEASIDVTRFSCEKGARVTLGKPVSGVEAYVLDGDGAPCGVSVAGELHLGGVQLAHGYHARAGMTAERFVPNPFGELGGRMYRTGDRARWNEDGTLDFLGRLDFQVKVRGHRVELGEVEAALQAVPAVGESVVVAADDQLHAYVTSAEGHAANLSAIRETLGSRLPAYMVPATVTVLKALPRTPAGKLDRQALPKPCPASQAGDAPRGEVEVALAAIWRDLLGIDHVGREDDFLSLGGTSLLATRLASRVRDELGKELPLRSLFETPRLHAMARRIAQEARDVTAEVKLAPQSDSARMRAALVEAGVDQNEVDQLDDDEVKQLVEDILK